MASATDIADPAQKGPRRSDHTAKNRPMRAMNPVSISCPPTGPVWSRASQATVFTMAGVARPR